MASRIFNDCTILDYIDAAMEESRLPPAPGEFPRTPLVAIELNKQEWMNLVNLIQVNYKDKAAVTDIIYANDVKQCKYKDVVIYYNGNDNVDYDNNYIAQLDSLLRRLDQARRPIEEIIPERTQGRGETPRAGVNIAAPTPRRPTPVPTFGADFDYQHVAAIQTPRT